MSIEAVYVRKGTENCYYTSQYFSGSGWKCGRCGIGNLKPEKGYRCRKCSARVVQVTTDSDMAIPALRIRKTLFV